MGDGGLETSRNSSVEDYGETPILTVVYYEETSWSAKTLAAVVHKRDGSRIGFYSFWGHK